jgi:hypothetical protein
MATNTNPALTFFLASLKEEGEWAQIVIRRISAGYQLRHVADRLVASERLRLVSIPELRKLSLFSAQGQFRPIKAAPDLQSGWVMVCRDASELWRALQELYPGSIPDWYAVQSGTAQATNYREFTNRQSGMYRITQHHSDEQAALVIAACCAPRLCLKRRFWTVNGLAADQAESKSQIPCLEPCAVLLEFARKCARIEQEEKTALALSASEINSILAAINSAIDHPQPGMRMADVNSPTNPRRLQLLLEKCQSKVKRPSTSETDD